VQNTLFWLCVVFATLIGGLAVALSCFVWVLSPLDRAAKNRRCAIQFALADLLCLFVLVQLPVGLIHRATEGFIPADVLLAIAAIVLWWGCVRTLSRAGIHVVWQRCVVLTGVMLVAACVPVAELLLIGAAVDLFQYQSHTNQDYLILFLAVPFFGVVYVMGRLTRAIVASAKKE
jgi:hypothetical protein